MTKHTAAVQIAFGALADPIRRQLRAQGITVTAAKAAGIQADANAITRLSIRGLLADAEKQRARQRLMKALVRQIQSGCVQ